MGGHGDGVHDRIAFERLFADNGPDVLAYALRRGDRATAEEVVAEVFVVAWRRRDRIPEREPVLRLYAVARRVLANGRRAARRRAALTAAMSVLARQRTADSRGAVAGGVESLRDALAALRPLDREVLMLTAWEGSTARGPRSCLDAARRPCTRGCTAPVPAWPRNSRAVAIRPPARNRRQPSRRAPR